MTLQIDLTKYNKTVAADLHDIPGIAEDNAITTEKAPRIKSGRETLKITQIGSYLFLDGY